MKLTLDVLNVLLLLTPGLISVQTFNLIHKNRSSSNLTLVAAALLVNILIAGLTELLTTWQPFAQFEQHNSTITLHFASNICLHGVTFGLALLLPIPWSYIHSNDIFFKVFRKLGLTDKSIHNSTWSDVFIENSTDRWVTIYFKDDTRLQGRLALYSDDYQEGALYLSEPAWITENGSTTLDSKGFLIHKDSINYIEFHFNNSEIGTAQEEDQK